ncbi:tetratricopeptide repeat protein SKI3 [Macadamia integrifolia]|uniref:tetratricopeptide repeat protein SKI3 n=1 Tax=Macadamia integrifolia TaxID=60698 RepID=UPI001C4EF3A9|nr:tetratricopeptide repeat protein SKI3 [Macadamia integrifolia]XP_042507078.1 tetratricopeptide repeat protein SKI3 [Macadamia integrifolia]XP_042507079.1 tetratricopeptide repeat protein SKI3 [Macadamia integrifolia]XP_042507080.1 tetratricopeptide repeat protein SKI3 [Macadamia integrifolia]XP_042507081.1 tetratricopeptide repeat protein SKI3 [Macadamia integrifolia]
MGDKEDEARLKQLQETVDSDPNNPSHHYNLGLFLWEKVDESKEFKEKAVEHFVISAKLNPNNGSAFRFLGHYYSRVSVDSQRASKCYQRAVTLNPDDFEAGEDLCDLLDDEGKESLEIVVCREASEKSPRAFWAFRRLGYLQVHQKKWSEAVQSLQHAIRGYPTCADLWEALGLAYQRLGMLTAAIKSYGRAIELEDSRVFALVESGNILLMLGSFRKGIEQLRQALDISPHNVAALYGLASGLLGLSKECVHSGAFGWGTSLLEEASEIVKTSIPLAGNNACSWKLHGDIQLTYAKCFPWMEEGFSLETDEAFRNSILSWKRKCLSAAIAASRSYQRSLHLAPWQANIYTDIAISLDLICSLEERSKPEPDAWQLPEKMSLGGLLLEGDNNDFWVALGCLSNNNALKQHAFVRGLQLDVSLAVAWAYLGKIYRKEGEKQLAKQAFDRARSIDPSLALPWAGMSVDTHAGGNTLYEAYESCLRAVQTLPLAEFQIGLGKLAALSGHLSSPLVFGAIRQAVQRAPHYPESHNLNGLVCEARSDYQSAVASYRLARFTICTSNSMGQDSLFCDISFNLARSLLLAGNALDAVRECELLKREGLLDSQGLQVYAISLWKLGKNDLALSMARNLAASVSTMESTSGATSISLIFKLLYHISGIESAVTSILKMPRELLQSSKISFIVSAIHALDHSSRLESIVSITRRFVTSHEEITGMHSLIALSKLVKQGSELNMEIQSRANHLKKALHMYPNSSLIRNELGYLLLSSKEWKDTHEVTRCVVVDPPGRPSVEASKSAYKILGAAAIACYACGTTNQKFSFPTCKDRFMHEGHATKQMQKWLHQEPWNDNARFLLLLNVLQKAREERFPQHLCVTLKRLLSAALLDEVYSKKDISYQYQKFQLLLCASEISFQGGDHFGCINHATNASRLALPGEILFFAHLLLCRAYAVQEDLSRLQGEYLKCLQLKTDIQIGWVCLKLLVSRYKLQIDSNTIDLNFEECFRERKSTSNMWMAVFDLVRGQIFIRNQDYHSAQETFAHACSLARADSCVLLCHGAICMELARQGYGSQFLSLAASSLRKAQGSAVIPLPIVSALLAQAEGSLGSKAKWEKNVRLEWFSWPPEMRPAELYFQMYLLAMQLKAGSDSASNIESYQSPKRWVLRAIHLNPSCLRYWKVLSKVERLP